MDKGTPGECKGCPIYEDLRITGGLRPIPGVVVNPIDGAVEVLFVGHAFNLSATRPFQGLAGEYLRKEVERRGIDSFLITNAYKCRLGFQTEYAGPHLGEICTELLEGELECNPKLVVTLGSPPSRVLTEENVKEMPDEVTGRSWHGYEMSLIALPHPSALSTHSNIFLLECWKRRWEKIGEFLRRRYG